MFSFWKKPQGITTQFVRWYTGFFLLVIVMISLAVVGTVSIYSFRGVKQEVVTIQSVMEQSGDRYSSADWGLFLEEAIYPHYAKYRMKLELPNNGRIVYSRDWEEFYEDEEDILSEQEVFFGLPLLTSVYWHEDEGLFYKDVFSLSSGEQVTIYASLEDIADFVLLLTHVLLIVGLTTIIVGGILIVLITKKNIQPITELAVAVDGIDFKNDLGKGLVVPTEPKEVANLAEKINDLMIALDHYVENEKSFVANASHELRTPIAAIHGHVNLIKRRGQAHPEIVESSVETIYQESVRMEQLISQLLAMARSENFAAEKEALSIQSIVQEVGQLYREKGANLALEIAVEEGIAVWGNREQIRQTCVILLDNALKYTDQQGTITVYLQQDKDQVILKVKDTGIGIPLGEQEKIFRRFYRVDKARSRETGGTGLGLTIAKEFIEQHNGTITVTSSLGEGSEFTVALPVLPRVE